MNVGMSLENLHDNWRLWNTAEVLGMVSSKAELAPRHGAVTAALEVGNNNGSEDGKKES